MLEVKKFWYRKAYTELNEIFKIMTQEELNKIPKQLIINVQKEMDKKYVFKLDRNKSLSEQKLMTETKALIIEIYEKYLCPEEDKHKWKEYDEFCLGLIEEQKRKKYGQVDFSKNVNLNADSNNDTQLIEYKKPSMLSKIFSKIKNFFTRKHKK